MKNKKIISKCILLKFLLSMLSDNYISPFSRGILFTRITAKTAKSNLPVLLLRSLNVTDCAV